MLDTLIFDPSACNFPKPRIPLLPTGLAGLSLKTSAPWASTENFRHFSRGRYALREAYRLAGIGAGGALLAPAYHCRTMLDPALALGGKVALYPLRPDLSPDISVLDALADNSPTPVKALLATHFFGLPQSLPQLAAWCEAKDITLIEDCSHVLFCEHHRPPDIGRYGEFIVSSPYKFLPSPDGGLLYARAAERLDNLATRSAAWMDEGRGLVAAWSMTTEHRRNSGTCNPGDIEADLAAITDRTTPIALEHRLNTACSPDYHREDEGREPLRYSRLAYRHPDIAMISRRRRENYRRWVDATSNLPYCRPLFPELPEGCIPYMFPLHIERPDPHFYRLKHLGVPIWRWDSMTASDCPTANDYRLHLLHLPCHQSLGEREMEWMTEAVQKVGAGDTPKAPQ